MTTETESSGTAPGPSEAGHPRRWLIVGAMSLCMFIAVMDNTVLTVALASIQKDLDASNASLQWSMDAYTLTFAALLLTAGLLGDRYGRRKVLVAGLVFFALVSAAGAWSGSAGQLIGWRAAMGVGAAVVPGCTMAVITTAVPRHERAKAIGLWSAAAGVGIAAGPIIGGALLEHFWWGSALLVNVPFVLVAIGLIVFCVPENRGGNSTARIDLPGVLLSTAATGALVFGIIEGGERSTLADAVVWVPLVASVLLYAVLAKVERRAANPAVDLGLLRRPRFAAGSGALAIIFFTAMGASFVVVFYLQILRGYSPLDSGLLMLPLAVGSMISAGVSDGLVKRFGAASAIAVGAVLMSAGLGLIGLLGASTPIWRFGAAQFVGGLGFGLAFSAAMAATVAMVPEEKAGAGSALANTARHVGSALGIAVLGAVLGAVYRHKLGDTTDPLPASVRDQAGDSLGSTAGALREVTERARELQGARDAASQAELKELLPAVRSARTILDRAADAFLDALQTTMWLTAGIGLLSAVVALVWLRGGTAAAADGPGDPAGPVRGGKPRASAGSAASEESPTG
ncbi:MFS transporter [Streptomyces mobaraensis]|uniref:MFS transporter n=1 Tax=Streptomyces mobaraensis TaxID=35621 RepID=A0A5N5W4I7_STRMB|nr:MFS transporter [Streptomyces mobaraensis]KAB7837199.1 MFS transporter [Streptomyces mobaraensis]